MGRHDSQPVSSASGLYVTLKVFQLVNQLKKRLRTRRQSTAAHAAETNKQAAKQRFERDAFHGIESCLSSHISGLDGRKSRARTEGVRKIRKQQCPKSLLESRRDDGRARNSFDRLLQDIDDALLCCDKLPPTKLAADNSLFIERRSDPSFAELSWIEVAQCLAFVHDAIETLNAITPSELSDKALCSGDELGVNAHIDATFLANLEHELLRLRGCLIQALIRKTVELLERGAWHNYWRRNGKLIGQGYGSCKDWFSEFPNIRRPLSTTFPWSIKPALAVLWGVCWMFYDNPNPGVSRQVFFQDPEAGRWINWEAPQEDEYLRFGRLAVEQGHPSRQFVNAGNEKMDRAAIGNTAICQEDRRATTEGVGSHVVFPPTSPGALMDTLSRSSLPTFAFATSGQLHPAQPHWPRQSRNNRIHQDPPVPTSQIVVGRSNNTAATPVSAHDQTHYSSNALLSPSHASVAAIPTFPRAAAPALLPSRTDQTLINALASWPHQARLGFATAAHQSQQHSSLHGVKTRNWTSHSPPSDSSPSTALPPAQARRVAHSHTLTSHLISPGLTVPALGDQDAAPLISVSPPEAPQGTLNLNNSASIRSDDSFAHEIASNIMGNNFLPADNPTSSRLLSPISMEMNGPEKSTSPHEDQRHQMPQTATYPEPPPPLHAHSPHSSHGESEELNHDSELYPPSRRGTTFKRADDPQRNEQGKMVCTYWNSPDFPECRVLTFDRRCEWSKHMDKHDRPYKCTHKGCEKLQGFTYSGGLLRHEREVHKMHGGTKKSLFCPHTDCKRSSGSGFTRKENLAEHIRRVHRTSTGSTDAGAVAAAVAAAGAAAQPHDYHLGRIHASPEAADPESRMDAPPAPVAVMDPSLNGDDGLKRKRTSMEIDGSEIDGMDSEGLRAEIKRLRRENEEKDERLRRLEATVAKLVGPQMATPMS